jgi:hypothetical protein
MPVFTLAGPEGNSMGNPSGTGDPEDEVDPLLAGETPPEDDPPEVLVIEPTQEEVDEFLATYIYTEEQAALFELAQSGEEDSEVAWEILMDSLTASFALHMLDQFNAL